MSFLTIVYDTIFSIYSYFRCKIFIFFMKLKKVSIGKDVFINWNSKIRSGTVIGDYTRIGGPIVIKEKGKVIIGKYCAIGWDVKIISANHLTTHANMQFKLQEEFGFSSLVENRGPIKIGNNVWIGDNVTILPGVKIGDGAVIGACSVVTKDVQPFSIVAGVPARVIRKRFDDAIIKKLLELKWWNWSKEKIKKNRLFFETDLTTISVIEFESIIRNLQ